MNFFKGFTFITSVIFILSLHMASCAKSDTPKPKDSVIKPIDTISLHDNLVAYYNFNNGNLNDSSGNANTIIFNNATLTTDRYGVANNAYLFNGSSSYMRIKNSVSLNPDSITVFAIVKVNGFYAGPCAGNDILLKGNSYAVTGIYSLNFFDFDANCGPYDSNNESFGGSYGDDIPVGVSAYCTADSVKIRTGQWYYIAYTYDRNVAKFYINGVLKSTRTVVVPSTPNSDDLYLGMNQSSYPYPFNGVIDEVRIYKKALSADLIKKLSPSYY